MLRLRRDLDVCISVFGRCYTIKCKKCHEREAEYCTRCHAFRRILLDKRFKKKVWANAYGRCEMCGETDERCLTVHHEDKEKYPFDVKKAKLVCLNCHWGRIHDFKHRAENLRQEMIFDDIAK